MLVKHVTCHIAKADLAHMFWSCNKLYNFWTMIFQTLSEAFGKDIPGEGSSMTNKIKNVLAFSTLLAWRRILLEWKSAHGLKASSWMKDLTFLELEKIKYSTTGPTQKFYDTWGPLLSYFEKLEVLLQD